MTKMGNRRSVRLRNYDYGQAGAYFVTLVVHGRDLALGMVVDGEVQLSPVGRLVQEEWRRTPELRPELELDAFVIMPNHLHGIVVISSVGSHDPESRAAQGSGTGAHGRAPLPARAPRSLGSFVAGF